MRNAGSPFIKDADGASVVVMLTFCLLTCFRFPYLAFLVPIEGKRKQEIQIGRVLEQGNTGGNPEAPLPKTHPREMPMEDRLNVKVKKFNQARVNGGSNYDST